MDIADMDFSEYEPVPDPVPVISRLNELGWKDFTIRERMVLKNRRDENADSLYKAFEHKEMGTVYCYSEQEAEAFLKQLEAHPPRQ